MSTDLSQSLCLDVSNLALIAHPSELAPCLRQAELSSPAFDRATGAHSVPIEKI